MTNNIVILDLTKLSETQTQRLNQIAKDSAEQYVRFVDNASKPYEKDFYWWITPFATRHSDMDCCFLDSCMLKLALEEIEQHRPKKIIVPKTALKRAIIHNIPNNKQLQIRVAETLKERMKELFPVTRAMFTLGKLYSRIVGAKKGIRKAGGLGFDWVNLKSSSVLLCSYVLESQFSEEGFKERDFVGLRDRSKKNMITWATSIYNTAIEGEDIAYKLVKIGKAIPYEAFVWRRDYVTVLKYIARSTEKKKALPKIGDLDISDLVKDSLKRGASCDNAMMGILRAKALRRFCSLFGSKVERIVEWYEGQPSSAATFWMRNHFISSIPILAYIGVPIDKTFMHMIPSSAQIDAGVAPHRIAVIGEVFKEEFDRSDNKVEVVIGPALRFMDIIRDNDTVLHHKVLVALSYYVDEAKNQIAMLKKIENFLNKAGIEVVIKNHPRFAGNEISDYGISELGFAYSFIEGRYAEALKEVDLVISSKSSTSFETVLRGKRVIIVFNRGICVTNMPRCWENKFYKVAYSCEQLCEAISAFYSTEFEVINDYETNRSIAKINSETIANLID